MPRLFLKSKRLKKQKTGRESQSQSPPVCSVGTQSEPLPLSYHLDSLLNSESSSPQASRVSYGASRGSYGGIVGSDEVDGTMGQFTPEEIRGPSRSSGRPPPSPAPHSARHTAAGLQENSWGEENRGLEYSGLWTDHKGGWSPSGSSQSLKEPTYYLPPPLIPSPPLTLTPSPPPPPSYSQPHHTTPQRHAVTITPPYPANCSLSPALSPSHEATSLNPSTDIVKTSSTPNTLLQTTPPPKPSKICSVSESAVAAWNTTLEELGAFLDQRNKGGTLGPIKEGGAKQGISRADKGANRRQISTVMASDHQRDERGRGEDGEEESREEEEIHQCHMALEERESRLIAEVAQLRTELRTESCGEEAVVHSPHPEEVVAELQETLRQTEQAVQAVEGERNELREGVGRMQEELQSLRRSNSLLAKRKQQWMEVASQVKVVLEENHSLVNQCKSQQRAISELRTQHHSRASALEREMSQMEQDKKDVEFQLKQMKDSQVCFIHHLSCIMGTSVGGASNLQSPDSLQHIAIQLERYEKVRQGEMVAQQERMACLEKENESLSVRAGEAKAVIRRLELEIGEVKDVVREGEEAVARLRNQLEEVQDREEATHLQLAHAIAQVDKAVAARDTYARIAKRWQSVHGDRSQDEVSRAVDEARRQLQKQEQEHRSQRRHYKTEIHRLRALLASMEEREKKRHKTQRKDRH